MTTHTISTTRSSNRTDAHRIGALCPEDYAFVLAYARPMMQDGWPIPGWNINCELERTFDQAGNLTSQRQHREDGLCCIIGLRHVAKVQWAEHGGTCKCTACGAHFGEGAVYRHRATGEHVNLGHTCAENFEFAMEDATFGATIEKLRAMGLKARLQRKEAEARDRILDGHPGLREAFSECTHRIVRDIYARFQEYGSKVLLSDKQVALCLKLHREQKDPSLAPQEKHVAAPEGRVELRGLVVAVKDYGDVDEPPAWKMTLKVETPDGSWLAWGTVPAALVGPRGAGGLKGKVVALRATLKRGRDAHFALLSRPTNMVVLDDAPVASTAA